MKHDMFIRSTRSMLREKTWTADGAAFLAGRALAQRDMCMAQARRTRTMDACKGWVSMARIMNQSYLHYQSLRRTYVNA